MPHRALSRSLLSLLMIWQLLASALAHPIQVPDARHADQVAMMAAMPEHPHCAQAASHDHTGDHAGMLMTEHAAGHAHCCQLACKCPCASTPALAIALPVMPAASPDHALSMVSFSSLPAPPVANLLRPPIG
jgi:hypothetical protein